MTLTIDGIAVTVPKGTLLVEAAKRVPVEIPVYCYHEKLGPAGLCRVCLVEVEGMPKLQIACNTPVSDGMVVKTMNPRVDDGRRAILEFLLLNHPLDCPICDKGGECDLQDYVVAYGQDASRLAEGKESKPKAVDLGPTIVLDEERCIVCQRCVRFDDIITRERSLVVVDRGSHDIIATATNEPYHSDFSGNVTEICPVGALTSKTYRFLSRPWDNHRTTSACTQCAVNCAQHVDVRNGAISRTMSVSDDEVSDGWLCDRGRYNIGYAHDEHRLRMPLYRDGDDFVQVAWDDAIDLWAQALQKSAAGDRIAALGGGRLLNEETFLLANFIRACGSPHLDWRTGYVRQTLPGRGAASITDLDGVDVVVVVGIPPSAQAPIFDLAIRKTVAHGHAKLFSVGALPANSHVPERRFAQVAELAAALPKETKRLALVWDGVDVTIGRELTAFHGELARRGVTVHTFVLGDAPNARGAEAMGMHPRFGAGYTPAPRPGLDATGIFRAAANGEIDVLSLHGSDPVLSFPDRDLVRAALARTPFIVVTELFASSTTPYANLVLPVAAAFERNGHVLNAWGELRTISAALPAPDGVLSDGEIIVALADRLGVALPDIAQTLALASNVVDAGRMQDFSLGDERLCGTPLPSGSVNGLRLVVTRTIFSGSGTLRHDSRLQQLRSQPIAIFAPQTAQRYGIVNGALVDLVDGERALRNLTAQIDAGVEENVVAVLDGLVEAPANALRVGMPIHVENIRHARELVGAPA